MGGAVEMGLFPLDGGSCEEIKWRLAKTFVVAPSPGIPGPPIFPLPGFFHSFGEGEGGGGFGKAIHLY